MPADFTAKEVIEMGVQIERNGFIFYELLSKKVTSEKVREIFEFLAGEEKRHVASFEKLLDSIQQYDPSEAYPDEYFAYMRELASEHVFTMAEEGAKIADSINDNKKAVEIALKFEKDSVLFYEQMQKIVGEEDKKIIQSLIYQEQQHVEKLKMLLSSC